VRLLLDIATLIWAAASPERLSRRAKTALEAGSNVLELSVISLAEIAIKQAAGKLQFSSVHIRQALEQLNVRILPYTADHAFLLFDLPLRHRDPFDRQIIVQALAEKIAVVTPDEAFLRYDQLKVIW
jgi:PIN domain nuclease of toxin-antitoxin system